MPFDPKAIKWDEPAPGGIDPNSIKWDADAIKWDDAAPDVNALDIGGSMVGQVAQGTGDVAKSIARTSGADQGVLSYATGVLSGLAGDFLTRRSADVRELAGQAASSIAGAIPFVGDDVAEDVYQRTHADTAEMQRSRKENTITGDIFDPKSVSLGTNPTTVGMVTNIGDTVARMAPAIVAARVNPLLGAAAGASQAYEGSRSEEADRIDSLPREEVMAMPRFRELVEEETGMPFEDGFASIGAAQSRIFDAQETDEDKATAAAGARALQRLKDEAGHTAGLWSAPLGLVQGYIFTGKIGGAVASSIRGTSKGVPGAMRAVAGTTAGATIGGFGEATTEVGQKVASAYGATTATGEKGRNLTADTAADAILGFGMGAGTNISKPKPVIDRVFGDAGINAGDVLGDVGEDEGGGPGRPIAPASRGDGSYTFDERGQVIEQGGGLVPVGPSPVPPDSPGYGMGPAGPLETDAANPDFIVDPAGGASAPGDWRSRLAASRARSGGPGMGPAVDGESTMAEPDMAQAAFDSAIESIQATIGRKPTKASLKATATSVAARFGVDPEMLIQRHAKPVKAPVMPDPIGPAAETPIVPTTVTPTTLVPTKVVAPAAPVTNAAPVPVGKMWRNGKGAMAVQTADGTWFTRVKRGTQWQPWQKRKTFDPSGAFGYSPYTPPSGNVRINGKVHAVGERRSEAKQAKAPPDVIDSIIAAGGLNREEMRKHGIDPKLFGTRRGATKWVFPRNGGMTLDALRQRLIDDGYFPPEDPDAPPTISNDDAFEIVQRALNQGERIVSINRAAEEAAHQAAQRADDPQPEGIDDADAELANEYMGRVEADPIAKRLFEQIDNDDEADALALNELVERALAAGVTPQEMRKAYDLHGFDGEPTADPVAARNLWELIRTKESENGTVTRTGQAGSGNGPAPETGRTEAAGDAAPGREADGVQGPTVGRDQPEGDQPAREQTEVERRGNTSRSAVDALPANERDAEIQRLRSANAELQRQLDTDPLTGVLSRAAYERDILSARGVATIDLKQFKGYNTVGGQTGGDLVLKAFAKAMQDAEADGVRAYRPGGDEFAFLSTDNEQSARDASDRLQQFAADIRLNLGKDGVTYSIEGVPFTAGIGHDAESADTDLSANKGDYDRNALPDSIRRADQGNVGSGNEAAGDGRNAAERDVQGPASPVTLTDNTVVTPPRAQRPASQSGLFGNVTAMDVERLNYERAQSEARTDQTRAPRPPVGDTVDLEEQIARNTKTPPTGGVSVSAERLTPDTLADMSPGAIVVDDKGREYRVHSARHKYAEAHPMRDGKPDINRDTKVIFHLDPASASAYPERNHSPIYATGRTADSGLDALYRQVKEQREARDKLARELVAQAGEFGSVEFVRDNGEALVGPDMSEPGRFRITRFDDKGPFSHSVFNTMAEAVESALKEGYQPKTPTEGDRNAQKPDVNTSAARNAEADGQANPASSAQADAGTDNGAPPADAAGRVNNAVDAAASEAAASPENDKPEPTEAQKEAGNYAKGHVRVHGLDFAIETPAGTSRRPEWPPLANHYGYIKRTEGADGEHVDVFFGPRAEDEAAPVFIVDQFDPKSGKFDEHKVMLGFSNELQARTAYLANYAPGWKGMKSVTRMSIDDFKSWLRDGDLKQPVANIPEKATPTKRGNPQAPEKIADFGEKIGGARKDTWSGFKDKLSEVSDDEILTEPLSKTWPQPDYQKMVDEGADSWVVAFMRAARDEIPRKPTATWKQKTWAAQVKLLRGVSLQLLNGTISVETAKANMAAMMSRGMREIASRVELYQLVGHAQSLVGVSFNEHHYSMYKGRNNVHLWVVEKETAATAFSNWPRELATGDTKEQMLQAFKEKIGSMEINPEKAQETAFDVYSRRGIDGFLIGKKVGRNHIDLAGPFKTVGEARDYRKANSAALIAKLEASKEIPKERRDTNEPRVGEDMRNGQDVTPTMFGEAFGFKGVEFGNWVEQKKRQADLNDAFDALMDMAAVLGIPPKAISLNGELGLAFGARGGGGTTAAAAHYEPGKVVINLTKKEGAGSLGHEWWHALDNYFQRMRGKKEYATESLDVSLASRGSKFVEDAKMRKEMVIAFGAVVSAIQSTAIKARSSKLDAKRTKEYWTTGREMAARAFESYLISKLQDQDASNDYLANIVDEDTWAASEKLGFELDASYPYPTAGEIPAIRAGFDKFFQTVEAREGDDGRVEIREDRAQYSGHAADVPNAVREDRAKAGRGRVRGDVQPAAGVPAQLDIFDVRPAERKPTLRERSDLLRKSVDVRTGTLRSGIERVTSLADAAHIFAPLRKYPVEQFMALVMDKDGKPLRVLRHSIGTIDGAGVYPDLLVAQIAAVDGATKVAFAHNHPSGMIDESAADVAITRRLVETLEGLGIEYIGHVIVAPGSKRATMVGEYGWTDITPARRSLEVPVSERQLRKNEKPSITFRDPSMVSGYAALNPSGAVLLLDGRHRMIGRVPMSAEEMMALRDNDTDGRPRARSLLAAISDVSADAFIVIAEDDKAGKNVASFLINKGRVLDVFVPGAGKPQSLAARGTDFAVGKFTSSPAGWSIAETGTDRLSDEVIEREVAKARAAFPGFTITVLDSIQDSPASAATKAKYPGANGLTDGVSRVWIFRNAQSLQALRMTLAHEITGHIGVESVIGSDWPAVQAEIERIRKGASMVSPALANAVKAAVSRYPKADPLTFARESVAIMAETGVTGSLWDRIVAAVRKYLRKVFGSLQWNENEIRDLLRRAGDSVRSKPAVFRGAEFEAAQVVFHGTPHKVDRFRMDKIGTGEGNQSYGWGAYFASRREVAETYKKALEKREYDIDDPAGIDASFWMQGVTRQQAIQNVESALANPPRSANAKVIADWKSDLAYLKGDKPIPQITARHGNLYSVNIPEDSDLLDWDKPLSEQPEKVQDAIDTVLRERYSPDMVEVYEQGWSEILGKHFYKDLAAEVLGGPDAAKRASEALNAAGIPGLRYLDGDSRANGEGSHNYVIWSEEAIGGPTMLASNPEPAKPLMASNPDGAITDTPEFKAWFGDSKVVDANGKPLVVYHGTGKNFDAFEQVQPRGSRHHFFSDDPGVASEYAGSTQYGTPSVIPAYLSLQSPYQFDAAGAQWGALPLDLFPSEISQHFDERNILRGRAGDDSLIGFSSVIEAAKKAGYDGVIANQIIDGGGTYGDMTPSRVAVAFRPEQIKSATGNRGTFDPNDPSIFASNPAPGPIERQMHENARAGQPIDKIFRAIPQALGMLDAQGRLKLGTKAFDALVRVLAEKRPDPDGPFGWAASIIETIRSGLIDRYGVPSEFLKRDQQRESEVRSVLMHAARVSAELEGLTTAEAKVLQAMLTGQEIPAGELGKLSQPIKESIDQMGREAVEMGLISPEAYARNHGAYLHRSYLKYEADRSKLGKFIGNLMDKRRKKLMGDTLRGRGMTMERDAETIATALGGSLAEGDIVTVLRQKTEKGVRTKYQRGPLNGAPPVGWESLGDWRVMKAVGKKAKLWRDFTPAEREKMGEILDARYNIVKTFSLMAHDLATGRFLKDIAANPEWATKDLPEGAVAAEAGGRYQTYSDSDWVRVPDAGIPGTNDGKGKPVKRWGALAGMYVRAPIWRDLNQLQEMQNPQLWGATWQDILRVWKMNKTARNPVVHMNNVMSNLVFMDLADIRLRDLYAAIGAYRRGEADADYRDAMAHGAFGGGFADQELKRKVLDPILDKILKEQRQDQPDDTAGKLGVLKALGSIWDLVKRADGKMLDAYNGEDEIFRLAFYLRRQSLGDTPQEAARAARRQFIDYDIRAPWVNMARNTLLPFIGYTYRSIPLLAQAIAERPWKLAKYATLAAVANWFGYWLGDEEDEEETDRKVMAPQVQGNTWTGSPRMMRMPWHDADGNPVFLDVRRWVPAGDVFDTNQSEIGMPAWLQFGGPLMLAGEYALNKQAFTRKPITDPLTDTTTEKAGKVASWAWKSFMPNAPWIPESYSWDKLQQAATGATDDLGRDYSVLEASSSVLGIKAAGHDVGLQRRYRAMDFDRVERELDFDASLLKREMTRKAISRERFDAGMAVIIEKKKRLNDERKRVLSR